MNAEQLASLLKTDAVRAPQSFEIETGRTKATIRMSREEVSLTAEINSKALLDAEPVDERAVSLTIFALQGLLMELVSRRLDRRRP
jgi:hypothetical protein